MLNRILQHQFYDAPDDNNGGSPQDIPNPADDKPTDTTDPEDKPVDDEHTIEAKERRRIYQDAINQFKGSDELKQIISDATAEGEKRAKMSADEKAEADRKAREEQEQKERDEFHKEQAHFYAKQELVDRKLPASFADYVADQDHDTMVANVDSFEKSFNEAVHDETLKRMQGDQTPAAGTQTPNATVTQKEWDAMSFTDQYAIQQKNPELAKQFTK